MADENAIFTEILEIKADGPAFEQSLATLTAAYQKWLAGLSEGAQVNIGSAGIAQSLKDMSDSLSEFAASATLLVKEYVDANTAASIKITEASNESTAKQVENAGTVATAGKKLAQDLSIEQEGLTTITGENTRKQELMYTGMFDKIISGEEKVAAAKELSQDRQRALFQDIEIEQEGVAQKEEEGIRKRELMYAGLFDQIEAGEAKVLAAAEKLNTTRVRPGEELDKAHLDALELDAKLAADASAAEEKLNLSRVRPGESIDKAHLEALALDAQLATQAASAEEKLNLSRVRPGEQVDKAHTEALATNQNQANTLSEQIDQAQVKIQALRNQAATVELGTNLPAKIAEISKQLGSLRAQLQQINQLQNTVPPGSEEHLALLKTEGELRSKIITLTREQTSAQNASTRESQGFFDKFGGGMLQSIVHLVRFTLLFTALNETFRIVAGTVAAPFKAIEEGVAYLQNVEKTAFELAVPLQANVEFTKDLAQNFKLSQEAAKELIPLLQTKSLQSGLPLDQLENVFKSLSGSGASQSVQNVRQLAEFAETFSIVLKASGRNALAVNGEIAKLSQLFSGDLKANQSLYLQTLHISTEEWHKIVAESKEHGNLLELLEPKIRPYLTAANKVGESQSVILEQIGLLVKQIEGDATLPLFDAISKALEGIKTFIEDNRDSIVSFISILGDMLKGVVDFASGLLQVPEVGAGIKSFFIGLAVILVTLKQAIVDTAIGLGGLAEIANNPLNAKSIFADMLKASEDNYQSTERLYKLIQNGPSGAIPTNPVDTFRLKEEAGQQLTATVKENQRLADLIAKESANKNTSVEQHLKTLDSLGHQLQDNINKGTDLENLIKRLSGIAVPSSILDTPITGKPGPDLKKNPVDFSGNIQDLKEDEQAYEKLLTEIKNKYLTFEQEMAQAVASGKADRTQASIEFHNNMVSEIADIEAAKVAFQQAALQDRDKVENTPATTDAEKKQRIHAISEINNAIVAENNRGDAQIQQIKNEASKLDIEADRERLRIREESYKADVALLKQALAQRLAAIKQNVSDSRLTEVEGIDQELQAHQAEHEAILFRIDVEQAAQDISALHYHQLGEQRIAEDQAYTNIHDSLTQKRVDDVYKEELAIQSFADKSRALFLEQQKLQLELQTTLFGDTGYSKAQQDLLASQERELAILQEQKALELEVALAKNENTEATRQLILQQQALDNQQQQAFNNRIKEIQSQVSSPLFRDVLTGGAIQAQRRTLQTNADNAQAAVENFQSGKTNTDGQTLDELVAKLRVLAGQAASTAQALKVFDESVGISVGDSLKATLEKSFLGSGFFAALQGTTEKVGKYGDSITYNTSATDKAAIVTVGLSNAFVKAAGIINSIQQGLAQGGVLGGAGAAASSAGGILGSLKGIAGIGSAIPVIGSVLSALGPVLSIVGDLFTAQARKIGEQVKKSFQDTVTSFQNGNTDLADTIISLERQRASAIAQLSGKKGGQDQLNSLLPQFDQEIASLLKQQQDLITSFETQLTALQMQSTTLSGISTQWAAINKQVRDYLAAGGDAVKAAQFLSLSLQGVQQSAQDQLDQGEQTAITDAQNLNNLLQQRIDLQTTMTNAAKAFQQSQFDLLNADSLERKAAGSVTRGEQIKANQDAYDIQTKAYQDQLTALDSQIGFEQTKVDKETAIFGLATDVADLQKEQNRLNLKALDDQIAKWTDLKSIVKSITLNPDGSLTGSGVTAPINNNFYINITGTNLTPAQVQDSLNTALEQAQRQGSPY